MEKYIYEYEIHMKNGDTIVARERVDGKENPQIEKDFFGSRLNPESIEGRRVHSGANMQWFSMRDVCWIKQVSIKELK